MRQENPSTAEAPGEAARRVVLASRSPRRRELLERHGYQFAVESSGFDDGQLTRGEVDPEEWVMALAYLKAQSVAEREDRACPRGVVIGADTICVKDGRLFGQPADERDAERTIRLLSGGVHEVLTGVALICPKRAKRMTFCDRSVVTVGELSEDQIESYLASGEWRGKAGAYNLCERIAAGWPIEFEGDPTSIMGLPMRALGDRLARFCDAA